MFASLVKNESLNIGCCFKVQILHYLLLLYTHNLR